MLKNLGKILTWAGVMLGWKFLQRFGHCGRIFFTDLPCDWIWIYFIQIR